MAGEIQIPPAPLAAAKRRLDPETWGRKVTGAMNESLGYLRGLVIARTPVDRGYLRGNLFTGLSGTPVTQLEGRVFPGPAVKEYAPVVEFGRQPGGRFPPIDVIAEWMQRKGITGVTPFVIARAIAVKGTRGHFMFRDATEEGRPVVLRIFRRSLS